MGSLVPALISLGLSALYFTGVDQTPEFGTARNGALLVVGLWLLVASLKQARLAVQPAMPLPPARPAVETARIHNQPSAAAPGISAAKPAPVEAPKRDSREVLGFLAMLQEKGRLLDFLMDDVSRYGDAQVGAAARVVHQGAGAAVREYFDIKPVADTQEGGALTLDPGYDAQRYRLVGRVTGEPPYSGHVLHRGWLAAQVKLPELRSQDSSHSSHSSQAQQPHIITPAEVELH